MTNGKWLLFVVLLSGCNIDFRAVATSLSECGAGTDCLYDPHEQACGWRQTTELVGEDAELLSEDGKAFVAPDLECVRVAVEGSRDHVLVQDGTDACEAELEGRRCAVLFPGETLTMFRRLGGEGWGDVKVARAPFETCALTCEE